MRLRHLRIAGFKSFVNETLIPVPDGITVIVGPNGCGKSNIVEAMRWVMGEGSAKRMRADEMDDVIFNGASGRSRRDFAEVRLILDNADGAAPPPYQQEAELEVSRRIDRGKGSFYSVNGDETRARDIQFLFADQGSGANSSAMVGQGKITALLEGKPTDRRILLEEAAGIRGLQSRKHESELKLQSTESNLQRLQVLLDEKAALNRELLKQAGEAQKYRELSNEISSQERLLAAIEWQALSLRLNELETQLEHCLKELTQKQTASTEFLNKITALEEKSDPLREAAVAAMANFNQAKMELNRREDEEKRLSHELQEWQERLKQAKSDAEHAKTANLEADSKYKAIQSELENLGKDHQAKQAELKTLLPELQSKQSEQRQMSEAMQAIHNELQQFQEKIALNENRLQELTAQKQAQQEKITATETQLQELQNPPLDDEEALALPEESEKHLAQLDENIAEITLQQSQYADILQGLRSKPEELNAKQKDIEAKIENELNPLRMQCQALEAEASYLQKRLEDDGITDEAVINQLQPKKGYETAIASLLGDAAFASLSQESQSYWQALENMPAGKIGDLIIATDIVKAPKELLRCLQHSFIAEDFETALSHLGDLQSGQIIVSKDGGLCRWDGYVQSPKKASSLAQNLQNKTRLQELQKLIPLNQKQVADLQEKIKIDVEKINDEMAKLQTEIRQNETALAANMEQANELYDKRQKLQSRVSAILAKRQELQNRIALSQERLQYFQAESVEIEKRMKSVQGELDSFHKDYEVKQKAQESTLAKLQSESEKIAEALQILQEKYSTLQGEVNYFNNRKTSLENDMRDWQERSKRESVRLEECLLRVGNGESRIVEIEARPEALQAEKESWLQEISAREVKAKEASEALNLLENEMAELQREKQGSAGELKRLQDLHDGIDSDLGGCRERMVELELYISDSFLLSPTELLSHFEEADLGGDVDKLRFSVERMKGRREALGQVNLQAEGEAEKLSAEIAETELERDDLEEAVKKLRLAIARLNAKAREQLEESFTKVDNNFSALFSRLFGGGSAALRWVVDDVILFA